MGALVPYTSAAIIRRELPNITDQIEYHRRVEALKAYAKDRAFAVANLEAQAAMAETVEAMRATGDLAGDGRPADNRDTLSRFLGVEPSAARQAMSRWSAVRAVPDDKRQQFYAAASGMPNRAKLVRWWAEQSKPAPAPVEVTTASLESLIAQGIKFGTIYADPAWAYGNQGTRASTDNHYTTMTVDDICALPVSQLVADQAHLHLWTTNAFLFDAHRVIQAWGFDYKSVLIWKKPQVGIGNYWRVNHEYLIFANRGNLQMTDSPGARKIRLYSVIEHDRIGHSAKPHLFRQMIEAVSPAPRLEMFARQVHHGWSAWGNEIEGSLYRDAS